MTYITIREGWNVKREQSKHSSLFTLYDMKQAQSKHEFKSKSCVLYSVNISLITTNDGIVKYNTIIDFIKKSTYQLSKNKLVSAINATDDNA